VTSHRLDFGLTNNQDRAYRICLLYRRWDFMSLNQPLSWTGAVEDFQSFMGVQFNEDDLSEFKHRYGSHKSAWQMAQALVDFATRRGYLS